METVRTGFVLVSLNGLKVCAADIDNAFLYGKTREKVYITAGPEFGKLCGRQRLVRTSEQLGSFSRTPFRQTKDYGIQTVIY